MAVERVELSEGEWWDIETRPTWGMMKSIRGVLFPDGEPAEIDGTSVRVPDALDASEHILMAFSTGWSFDGEITVATISDRAIDELIPVLQLANEKLVPLFEALGSTRSAN